MGYWEDLRGDTDKNNRRLEMQTRNSSDIIRQPENIPNSIHKQAPTLEDFFAKRTVENVRNVGNSYLKGRWWNGISPAVQMGEAMGADMWRPWEQRMKIDAEESARFVRGHKMLSKNGAFMDLSSAGRQSIVLNNSEGAIEGTGGLKSPGAGLSELDKKIRNIEEILASRGEQTNIDMRRFVILKTLATQGRLPTVEELENFGGGVVTPSEARSAKQQVEQIPDMIWEDEASTEGTEERSVPAWKKALEAQWAADEAKGRRARYENDEALKLYSLNRQYSIMNAMKRENRWVTNADLNRDGREAPMKPSELVAAMRAQKQITEDMEHGKHSRLEADRVLYRGAGSFYTNLLKKTFGIREGDSEEVMRRKMQGGCITDKALMSSTLAPIKAKEFADNGTQQGETGTIIQLYAPKGTKGQYIAPISAYQNEREMLLNNDTCIRIVDVGNYQAAPGAKDKRNYLQIRGAITAGNLLGAHRRKN